MQSGSQQHQGFAESTVLALRCQGCFSLCLFVYLVMYCYVAILPQMQWPKTTYIYISQSLWVSSWAQCSRALCFRLSQSCSEGADLGCSLIWGSTVEGSISQLTWLLTAFSLLAPAGWGQQFWLALSWRLPSVPCQVAALRLPLVSSKPAKETLLPRQTSPHKTNVTVSHNVITYMQTHTSHRLCRECGALIGLPTIVCFSL